MDAVSKQARFVEVCGACGLGRPGDDSKNHGQQPGQGSVFTELMPADLKEPVNPHVDSEIALDVVS